MQVLFLLSLLYEGTHLCFYEIWQSYWGQRCCAEKMWQLLWFAWNRCWQNSWSDVLKNWLGNNHAALWPWPLPLCLLGITCTHQPSSCKTVFSGKRSEMARMYIHIVYRSLYPGLNKYCIDVNKWSGLSKTHHWQDMFVK